MFEVACEGNLQPRSPSRTDFFGQVTSCLSLSAGAQIWEDRTPHADVLPRMNSHSLELHYTEHPTRAPSSENGMGGLDIQIERRGGERAFSLGTILDRIALM